MQSGAVYAMTKGAMNILTKYLAASGRRTASASTPSRPGTSTAPPKQVLKDVA